MKKLFAIFAAAVLAAGCLSACGTETVTDTPTAQKSGDDIAEASGEKLQIVTTIFPEYDWTKEVLGDLADNAELTLLLDNGVDLHSYQPTVDDILKISTCDLFIYVGGESDDWVEDALAESTNPDMVVINLLDVLGDSVKTEEIVEGMEHVHDHDHEDEDSEEEHDHDHEDEDSEEEHDHDREEEKDEHVWLSLRNAMTLCDAIAEALGQIDSVNADIYRTNADAYNALLSDLDAQYAEAVAAADKDTLLFGDRFPFRYLVDDYDLDYYAAFTGCSAETEASFETIVFLAGKVDELGLNSILTIENTQHRIAETVRDNTESKDQTILVMDSLQSTTSDDIAAGTTYLSVMTDNLEVLKEALK